MEKVKDKIPKICGECEHYIFRDKEGDLINECGKGIGIVNNESLDDGCQLFQECFKCDLCGILIGPHHLNTMPISVDSKILCGMCYWDRRRSKA